MDRRQRKTRDAIFSAFIDLLTEKDVNKITVSDVIERADIGRATFYSHFETKDFLIKDLCEELFCHIFDSMNEHKGHHHIFECDDHDTVFVHLLTHLQKNDNNILELLSGRNNELFLSYFKDNLLRLIESQDELYAYSTKSGLPHDYWTNHIASTFVETIRWWIKNGMSQNADEIAGLFLKAINAEI